MFDTIVMMLPWCLASALGAFTWQLSRDKKMFHKAGEAWMREAKESVDKLNNAYKTINDMADKHREEIRRLREAREVEKSFKEGFNFRPLISGGPPMGTPNPRTGEAQP